MLYSPHRVRRFFDSVKGFHAVRLFSYARLGLGISDMVYHQGELDLMGRFKPRYVDLILRWEAFGAQLCTLRAEDTQQNATSLDKECKGLADPFHVEALISTAHRVHSKSLESFCCQWHLSTSTINIDLESFYQNYGEQQTMTASQMNLMIIVLI